MKDSHHTEQELIRLETSYWQALKDRDHDKALELTDDPGIVTGAQGVASLDKRAMKKMMDDQGQVQWSVEDFKLATSRHACSATTSASSPTRCTRT